MQNAGLAALGLNWRCLAFKVHPDNLRAAIRGAQAMNFTGLNLTVPHKLMALEMVDAIDEAAKGWGAVNTIRFEGRDQSGNWRPLREFNEPPCEVRSHGFNTDAAAIVCSLQEDLGFRVAGARILLLGAGGAGRAAAMKLASECPAELFLVNRTRSKAEAVAAEIGQRSPDVKVALSYPTGRVDLVLNAISLGLKANDPLPFYEEQLSLSQAGAVYDMVYRPAETPLLSAAKAAGCRATNGIGMLLYQGTAALELWTGQVAPVEVMRQALEKEVYG